MIRRFLIHLAARLLSAHATQTQRARVRATTAQLAAELRAQGWMPKVRA